MPFMKLPPEIARVVRLACLWALFIIMLLNPLGDPFLRSIGNQEFFAYHIKDLLGLSSPAVSKSDIYLATGTYERQINGDLFGVASGRNLIVIQVESLQDSVVQAAYNGVEITPALNRLIDQGAIYFDNFYQQLGSGNTSDAEFAMNNSMLGAIESYTYNLYQENYFRGLPWILKQEGYETMVLHGYHKDFWNRENAYPNQGFDRFIGGEDFENDNLVGIGGVQGVSDEEFFRQSIPYLQDAREPFYSFYVTLSSHHPFKLPETLKEIPILPEDQGTIFGDYLNSIRYADSSIGSFIEQLKENGLYEKSMIVIYGDHFALSQADEEIKASVSNYLGYDYDIGEMMNVPLIISIPGANVGQTVHISGGETDIMPTLAYLLGIEKLDTIYFGRNLLTAKTGFVPQQTHLLKGSFIKDDIIFEMSRDGVFENSQAWNRKTKEAVAIEGLREDYLEAKRQVEMSQFYLKNDVLRKVLLEGKTIEQITLAADEEGPPAVIGVAGLPPEGLEGSWDKEALDEAWQYGYRYIYARVGSDHRNGYLTAKEVADWLNTHEDACIVLDNRHQLLDTLKTYRSEYSELCGRIIPVVRKPGDYTMVEYQGFDRILFLPESGLMDRKEISDFCALNDVWAAALPANGIPAGYSMLLGGSTHIYAYNAGSPTLESLLRAAGVDGFISGLRTLPIRR